MVDSEVSYCFACQEEVWEKIQAHRAKVRAANQPYADNRSFSNDVRELVKKGQLQEARQLCLKQVQSKIHFSIFSWGCLPSDFQLACRVQLSVLPICLVSNLKARHVVFNDLQ